MVRAVIHNSKYSGQPLKICNTTNRKGTSHRESNAQAGVMANTRLLQKLWPHKVKHDPRIFIQKGDDMRENFKKTLVRVGIKNGAELTLTTDLIHGIYLRRKGQLTLPHLKTYK